MAADSKAPMSPTRDNVSSIADKYIDEVSPKLTPEEKTSVDSTMFILNSKKSTPSIYKEAADELLNSCTVALANTKDIKKLIVITAKLFKEIPDNARTANMLGVTLFAIGRKNDAITVVEYGLSLKPNNTLLLMNAVNMYFDMDEAETAKAYLDKVISIDKDNRAAYSALATYWYAKGDLDKAVGAMVKAATLGGVVIVKKADADKKKIEDSTGAQSDILPVLESKTTALKDILPKTTADIIEDRFPSQAEEIRSRYLKLIENEKMVMPGIPSANTHDAKGWLSNGLHIIKEWQKQFLDKAKKETGKVMAMQYGVNPGDSKAVKKAKGRALAKEQIEKSLADVDDMLEAMKGMGIPESKIRLAEQKMKKVRDKHGIAAPSPAAEESPSDTEITSDEEMRKYERSLVIPGWDNGSVFAMTNFRDYVAIRSTYEIYFRELFKDLNSKIADVMRVYEEKAKEEKDRHEDVMKRIEEEAKAEARANDGVVPDPEKYEMRARDEKLMHKKKMNAIGNDYFNQWSGIVFPQYRSKMKPKLEEFWNVCALYIRNMNDTEVMKAEYSKVKQIYLNTASMSVSMLSCGTTFKYYGDTYEEEQEIEKDRALAKERAEAEKAAYAESSKLAESALEQWINDTFALGISGQFLSMKVTPRKLVIEEYIAGMNFKHVYDFKTGEWSIYRSFCAKIDVGIQIGPMKAGVSARADILESYDVINTRNGQVVNAGSSFARGSVGGSLGADKLSVSGGAVVTLDPAAESELSVKFNKSAGYKDSLSSDKDYKDLKGGMTF